MRKGPVRTVRIIVRSTTSRVPFRPGSYSATLDDEGSRSYEILGMTRQHDTWARAAGAALRLADRRGYLVANRELVKRRIASEAP